MTREEEHLAKQSILDGLLPAIWETLPSYKTVIFDPSYPRIVVTEKNGKDVVSFQVRVNLPVAALEVGGIAHDDEFDRLPLCNPRLESGLRAWIRKLYTKWGYILREDGTVCHRSSNSERCEPVGIQG